MKAKAIFFSVPALGDTYPLLGTLAELVNRGHQIIYYGAKEFEQILKPTGVEFRIYNETIKSINFESAELSMVDFFDSLLEYGLGVLDHHLLEALDENPNYILHGNLSSWGKALGKISGLPTINLFHSAAMLNRDKMGEKGTFTNFLLPLLFYKIKALFSKDSKVRKLKELTKFSVKLLDLTQCEEDLNLIYNTPRYCEEFLKGNYRYQAVGPSLFFKKDNAQEEFKNFNLYYPKEAVVYISLGTIHSDNADFFNLCFDTFGDSKINILMATGKGTDSFKDLISTRKITIPENFIIEEFFPQQSILHFCDLFITHGGMNSVNESLYHGVPLLVLPHHLEQGANAKRIEEFKLGLRSTISSLSKASFSELVMKILNDSSFKKNAVQFSKEFKNAESEAPEKAANAIEDFVEQQQTV
jgi:MGT family glycosyltransferase